ncbi:MAG: glycosyltransferase family 2 protein [Phycisphaerae bacterium]
MPTTPGVSVIVPVYNDAARLRRCLDALSASTFTAFEIIVVDDGSTDDSPAVAEAAGPRLVRMPRQSGPALARNQGAEVARSPILFFVDADVLVHPDAVGRVFDNLSPSDAPDAVFGSYDDTPEHPAVISRFKNLFHHHTHQHAREEAGTFWSGCGAMRRDVFLRHGGYSQTYHRPCIEDVELGIRLTAAGGRVRLDKRLQGRHLKRWTLTGLVKTDVFDRGIPWTRLLLETGRPADDLNVSHLQKLAAAGAATAALAWTAAGFAVPALFPLPFAVLGIAVAADVATARLASPAARLAAERAAAIAFVLLLAAGVVLAPLVSLLALAGLGVMCVINLGFCRLLLRQGGWAMALLGMPLLVLYYLYSVVAFAAGHVAYAVRPPPAAAEPWPAPRRRITYAGVGLVLFVVAGVLNVLMPLDPRPTYEFLIWDQKGYFAWLPTLVLDKDLDFKNQRVESAEAAWKRVEAGDTAATAGNKYPMGTALTAAPGFVAVHAFYHLCKQLGLGEPFVPDGYSLPYQLAAVGMLIAFAVLAMVLADDLLTKRFGVSGRVALGAVLLVWLGSASIFYLIRHPLYSHTTAAAWITLAAWTAHRLFTAFAKRERAPLVAWGLFSLACAMTAITRKPDALIVLPLAAFVAFAGARAAGWRPTGRLLVVAAVVVAMATPLFLQYAADSVMLAESRRVADLAAAEASRVKPAVADPQAVGYRSDEVFYWTDPALVQTLFSSRKGLFFFAPVLLLSAWGVGRHVLGRDVFGRDGRRDPLVLCLLAGAAGIWYLNSSWYAWWFGSPFGARAFIGLNVLFVIGMGLGLRHVGSLSPGRQSLVRVGVGVALAWHLFLLTLWITGAVVKDDYLIQAEKRTAHGFFERF